MMSILLTFAALIVLLQFCAIYGICRVWASSDEGNETLDKIAGILEKQLQAQTAQAEARAKRNRAVTEYLESDSGRAALRARLAARLAQEQKSA